MAALLKHFASRRSLARLVWLAGVAMTFDAAHALPSRPQPNVLLIIADDLRPDLGCYANPEARTPNIDRLAREGVVFARAFCSQALCAPSRAALFTGARPDSMRVWDVWTHFRAAMPDVVTLPQLLKQHGRFTQALGKVYPTNLDDPPSWSVPHVMPLDPLYGSPATKALLAEKRRRAEAAGLTGVPLARAIRSGPPAEAPEIPDNALVDGQIADLAVDALRIPLIIRAPGLAPTGGQAGGMVEVVDLYPSLVDLCGIPRPSHLEGTTFLPLLNRPQARWKQAVFTQSPQTAGDRVVKGYSMVTETHRLTRWIDRTEPEREIAIELYDLKRDPGETRNVATDPAYSRVREELIADLASGWRNQSPPQPGK